MVKNVWRKEYGRKRMGDRVCQGMYGGESMVEKVWGREYGKKKYEGESMVENV